MLPITASSNINSINNFFYIILIRICSNSQQTPYNNSSANFASFEPIGVSVLFPWLWYVSWHARCFCFRSLGVTRGLTWRVCLFLVSIEIWSWFKTSSTLLFQFSANLGAPVSHIVQLDFDAVSHIRFSRSATPELILRCLPKIANHFQFMSHPGRFEHNLLARVNVFDPKFHNLELFSFYNIWQTFVQYKYDGLIQINNIKQWGWGCCNICYSK